MKTNLLKGAALLLMAVAGASCSHDDIQYVDTTRQDYNNNFKENILGGQDIDPNQDWKTAVNTPVKISVDLDYDADYTVYIFTSAPLVGDAAYIGKVTMKSGEEKTINVARPVNAVMLYAACYDKNNVASAKMFVVTKDGGAVAFGTKAVATARRRAISEGNRWSVATKSMPDLSAYTTGTLYEMQEAFNTNGTTEVNQADGSEKHLKITGTYEGGIARIQSYANQSVYVTGKWIVPEDQRCTGSSVIVVGNGGEIVVPEGCMLSTNANNEAGTTGMIYVMPGGKITGAGTLQFSNGTETYSYNAGDITVKNININGGTLYNAGNLGTDGETDASKLPSLTGPAGTDDAPSKLINLGHCTLDRMDGAGISIENACNMTVINDLCLGKSSKMDDGSYIKCGRLELNGSNNGNIILYMGNGSCMNCVGNFAVLNFGVWGPNSNNGGTINNATFKIGGCANTNENGRAGCNYTANDPTTFLLDHVNLVLPENYPTALDAIQYGHDGYDHGYIYDYGENYRAKLLIHGWYNGYACRLINPNSYVQGEMIHDWYNDENGYHPAQYAWVWNAGSLTCFGDDSRATCDYAMTNSFSFAPNSDDNCGIVINRTPDPDPVSNYIYYAFEDLGSTKDFDFNDVVLRVATPEEQSDGTFTSTVQILAAGGELEAYVLYNGNPFGAEVHQALGGSSRAITNTRTVDTSLFSTLSTITGLASADVDLTNLPFTLKVIKGGKETIVGGSGTKVTGTVQEKNIAPLFVVVSGDDQTGKWFWPYELVDISVAYPQFGAWGANASTNLEWYKNPANGTQKIVNY